MVMIAIGAAQRAGKKIGICGQAPSDYPEFARFLVERGISSISLNPDTVLQTTHIILEAEAELAAIEVISTLTDEAAAIGISPSVSSAVARPGGVVPLNDLTE
jgi:phosphoenolpyruvate-protein kinase (PTS system EI component)